MNNQPSLSNNKVKNTMPWVWLALAIVYTLSPLDLLPDSFPFLGWLDDLSLLTAAILNLLQHYHQETHKQLGLILKYLKWLCLIFAFLLVVLLGILSYLLFF